MSKHTTPPARSGYGNSHTWNIMNRGNWNKHAHRRVPSSLRTPGRIARNIRRGTDSPVVTQATYAHVAGIMERAAAIHYRWEAMAAREASLSHALTA